MTWNAKLVAVGRVREIFAQEGCARYLDRIRPHIQLEEILVRDAEGDPARRQIQEGRAILQAVDSRDHVVLLDERGKGMSSRVFAQNLGRWFEDPGRTPCFVIGGPYGVSPEVRQRANHMLRLGTMTWPHELCRVMFLEQLYRGAAILKGLPYHHD